MSNRTILFIVGIAVVFGAIKSFKGVNLFSSRPASNLQLDWRNMDYRPYQRQDIENDPEQAAFAEKQKSFRLAKANTFTSAEIGAQKPATPTTAAAETKDKDKKKKKKKKKAARKASPAVQNRMTAQSPQMKAAAVTSPYVSPAAGGGTPIPEPQADENKSFQEWANLLLTRPNQVLVDRFIREFQSNLVTPDVFYAIIDLMYQKDDSEFKRLAVRAAGSVQTIRSYDFLLGVMSKESGGSTIASAAQKELYQYELPIALHVLLTILTSRTQDETAVSDAVQSLERSTTKYMKATDTTFTRLYQSFIVPLQNIITVHADNASIADVARRALERIQSGGTDSDPQDEQNAFIDNPQVVAGN